MGLFLHSKNPTYILSETVVIRVETEVGAVAVEFSFAQSGITNNLSIKILIIMFPIPRRSIHYPLPVVSLM